MAADSHHFRDVEVLIWFEMKAIMAVDGEPVDGYGMVQK